MSSLLHQSLILIAMHLQCAFIVRTTSRTTQTYRRTHTFTCWVDNGALMSARQKVGGESISWQKEQKGFDNGEEIFPPNSVGSNLCQTYRHRGFSLIMQWRKVGGGYRKMKHGFITLLEWKEGHRVRTYKNMWRGEELEKRRYEEVGKAVGGWGTKLERRGWEKWRWKRKKKSNPKVSAPESNLSPILGA